MEKRKLKRQNALEMSLGSNKNPMNITLGGRDKNVQIRFNSKKNKNIWLPPSTTPGRYRRQCCLYKHPANEITLTFPENGKFLVPNGLPFVIESQYLENFKAAFYPPQLFENEAESVRDANSLSLNDYSEEINDESQYPALMGSETLHKEESKKEPVMMKHIHTLRRNLEKIGKTLKEIEECQTETENKENQKNLYHNRIKDKYKIKKHSTMQDGSLTLPKHDKSLSSSKFEKFVREIEDTKQVITNIVFPVKRVSQKKRKSDMLSSGIKVRNHAMIQEEKLGRKENQVDNHSMREGNLTSVGKTLTESADNTKNLNSDHDDSLLQEKSKTDFESLTPKHHKSLPSSKKSVEAIKDSDQAIKVTPITPVHPLEDALQNKRKIYALSAGNTERQQTVMNKQIREEAEPGGKENEDRYHSVREDAFASAGKIMAEIADGMENSNLVLDDILQRENIMNDYKKKYIQEVEELYTDQQRVLEAICNIFKCSKFGSSEEDISDRESVDQQQDCKNNRDEVSECKNDLQEVKNEDLRKCNLNGMPNRASVLKEQSLEEHLALANLQLEKLINEIELLRESHILITKDEKAALIPKDWEIQEKGTEISKTNITVDEGVNASADSPVKVVSGIISHKYNIVKGEQRQGNFYETTLTQTVKNFPTDDSKLDQLSYKECLENLSDAQNAMKKLVATFEKLIPVIPKVSQQREVGPDTPITVSHHEENISGKILLKERKIEPSNDHGRVAKDKTRRDSEARLTVKDETSKKFHGVLSEGSESERFKRGESSETIPKRQDSNSKTRRSSTVSLGFEPSIENKVDLEQKSSSKSKKTFKPPSAVKNHDDVKQPSQIRQPDVESPVVSTKITHEKKTAQRAHVSTPVSISRNSAVDKIDDKGKKLPLSGKSPRVKPHATRESEYDSVVLQKGKPRLTRQLGVEEKFQSNDVIEEGTISSISQYDLEAPEEEGIIEGTISSISQYEFDPSEEEGIIEGTISSISQYELDLSKEDRQKSKDDEKLGSDIIEGTISSISQYELEKNSHNGRSLGVLSKRRSDVIEEGRLASMSQNELEQSQDLDLHISSKQSEHTYDPHSKSKYVPDEDVGSPLSVPDGDEFSYVENYFKYKPKYAQRGRTSSKEQSQKRYAVNEYKEPTLKEPNTEEADHIENGSKFKQKHVLQKIISSEEKSQKWYPLEEYKGSTISEPDIEEFKQRGRTSSDEQSQKWYRMKEYTGSTVSEPDIKEFKQRGRTSSDEKSQKWYRMKQYTGPTVSEPGSEEFKQQSRTASDEQSQKWYRMKEYTGPTVSEPGSEEFKQRSRTTSDEQSQKWYRMKEYIGPTVSEPGSEEFKQQSRIASDEQSQKWYRMKEYTGSTVNALGSEEFKQRGRTSSDEQSQKWYRMKEYTGSTVSEPDTEEFNQRHLIYSDGQLQKRYPMEDYKEAALGEHDSEELNHSENGYNFKQNMQRGRTSSNEQSKKRYVLDKLEQVQQQDPHISSKRLNHISDPHSQSKYVPDEDVGSPSSVPNGDEFSYVENYFKYKPKYAQLDRTSTKGQPQNWYALDGYKGSSLNEPSSKEFNKIQQQMPGMLNYTTEQLRESDISNQNRRRSLPVRENQDKFSQIPQRLHRLNTYAGLTLRDADVDKMPNVTSIHQPATFSESRREKFPLRFSTEFHLKGQNFGHSGLPYAFDDENEKAAFTKPRERAATFHDVYANARNQNVLNETQYRDLPHFSESVPLRNPEFTRNIYDRTFKTPLNGLQDYPEFGSFEDAKIAQQSPKWTNENTNRRQKYDINYDYNQRNKIRKLYDEIMS